MKFMSLKDISYCGKNFDTDREKVMKMIEEEKDAWDELFRVGKYMGCSECGKANEKTNNYCISCNHKLKDIPKTDKVYREYCPVCKEMITSDMNYCGEYGHEIRRNVKDKICPICGKMVVNERYCINCGHDFF